MESSITILEDVQAIEAIVEALQELDSRDLAREVSRITNQKNVVIAQDASVDPKELENEEVYTDGMAIGTVSRKGRIILYDNRFWSEPLDTDQKDALNMSMNKNDVVTIVDEGVGGIIGYALEDHKETVLKALRKNAGIV
jgi:hypothetical protein